MGDAKRDIAVIHNIPVADIGIGYCRNIDRVGLNSVISMSTVWSYLPQAIHQFPSYKEFSQWLYSLYGYTVKSAIQ